MASKKEDKISLSSEQKELLDGAVQEERPLEYVETGVVGLDLALTDGKGLPMGSSTLLWALPGCGKTTVVADVCKRLIKKNKAMGEPFKVLYLDVEDSTGLITAMGLDEFEKTKDFLHVRKRLCWRNVETFYDAVLQGYGDYKNVKLIVIDSVNSVLSDQNMKNSVADGDYGTKSRERSAFYSKYLPLCKEKGVSSFFISQVRQKQNASLYEDPNKAAVSNVDLHYVDVILKCSASTNKTDASKIEEETIFGKDTVISKYIFKMDSKATGCKNRYIKGHAVEMMVEKGRGVCNFYAVRKLLEGNKLLKGVSGWYTFDPDLIKTFNLPDHKYKLKEVNEIIHKNTGELVDMLKKMGKYKVSIQETEVPITEDDDELIEEEE